jgi:hypothetical protein
VINEELDFVQSLLISYVSYLSDLIVSFRTILLIIQFFEQETIKGGAADRGAMRLLLVVSSQNKLRDVEGLTFAAAKAGHNVIVFFNEASVNLLKKPSSVESLYADLLACKASAVEYGITKDNMVGNARMSSLIELVEQLETADRVVFLG